MGLIETAVTRWHRWAQQSANPTTPAATYWNLFFKAGGLYTINSAGDAIAHGGGAITTLTIATGAITITQKHHFVDTQASAASDDLDTINGGVEGQELFLQADQSSRTVVLKHATDNIRTWNGQDISLDETYKTAHLLFDGSFWNVLGERVLPFDDLSAWNGYPDAGSDLYFWAQEANGTNWHFKGDELRMQAYASIGSDLTTDSDSLMSIFFDDTTARTLTLTNVLRGHSMVVKIKTAPGAGNHKILLPVGCYWNADATNRAVLFDSTSDYLFAVATSSTSYEVMQSTGVTYAAS